MFRLRLQPIPCTIVIFGMFSGQRNTPGNGLLEGPKRRAILIDFGLASRVGADGMVDADAGTKEFLGTDIQQDWRSKCQAIISGLFDCWFG